RPQASTLLTTRGKGQGYREGVPIERLSRAIGPGARAKFRQKVEHADGAGTPTSGRADHQLQELGEDAGGGAPDRLVLELEGVHRPVVLAWEVPALFAVHLVGDQLGQADVEDAGHLGGIG